eukprot:PhF_6_TR40931/c0_g1_i2/m.61921/K00675/nhoA; N-hydroxyarylamine O-acetyltransferase
MSEFTLEKYLNRIGESRLLSAPPTLATLSAIVLSHLQNIPFENFDVIDKVPILMDLTHLTQKLIDNRRGGFCFEHNTLLRAALIALGFSVDPFLARVRWLRPPEVITPYTHMVLVVNNVEGKGVNYLIDVGFGGVNPMEPLPVLEGEAMKMKDGHYRVVSRTGPNKVDPYTVLQWDKNTNQSQWYDMYMYRGNAPATQIDMDVASWWAATHPTARWMNCLFTSILDKDCNRHMLLNHEYSITKPSGESKKTPIRSFEEFHKVSSEVMTVNHSTYLEVPNLKWPSPGQE